MIRKAALSDIKRLVEIENFSFHTDRISLRSFRYLLTRANSETIVDEKNGVIRGYAMLLFHTGIYLARLYSMAVDPAFRGKRLGDRLLSGIEKIEVERSCVYIRLEVRSDNASAIGLGITKEYKKIGIIPGYYEDMMEATRYEKYLRTREKPALALVSYYKQTLDFTCGASCLMMAMHAIDPSFIMDRRNELRIWREANMVFMTSGHGGCGPYGMALAAFKRGFDVTVFIEGEPGALFLDSVRSGEKKEVMRLVQQDFFEQLKMLSVKIKKRSLSIEEMEEQFHSGGIPIVLISTYRINREKSPHWVTVTGIDDKYVYCHDPYVDYGREKSSIDCVNMPVLKSDFEKMAKYGKSMLRAALVINSKK